MLGELSGVAKIYLVTGYTDMRKSIDGLMGIIQNTYRLDPYSNALFLFCGRRGDRIKALIWEGNGFLLLYKRFEAGSLSWPRTPEEAVCLNKHEYRLLLQGLNPVHPRIRDVHPQTSG